MADAPWNGCIRQWMYTFCSAWGVCVARFNILGNARAFTSWNEGAGSGSTFFSYV